MVLVISVHIASSTLHVLQDLLSAPALHAAAAATPHVFLLHKFALFVRLIRASTVVKR